MGRSRSSSLDPRGRGSSTVGGLVPGEAIGFFPIHLLPCLDGCLGEDIYEVRAAAPSAFISTSANPLSSRYFLSFFHRSCSAGPAG